jgi:DNA-binding response OmpR family regulator
MFKFLQKFRKDKAQNRQKKRILVIEDEANLSLLIKEILQRQCGYEVLTAADGKIGLSLAKDTQPDLVLLDIKLPIMDGFEVLRKLKEDKGTFAIPVIMLSGCADMDSKLKVSYLHSDDFITKPFSTEGLVSKVKSRLGD